MIEKSIVLSADQLSGGSVSLFRGLEIVTPDGRDNVSATRLCIELGKNEVRGNFVYRPGVYDEKAVFRIRGMWDMYREMPLEMANLTSKINTTGNFEVILNDKVIYNGDITFWNYRCWRFWPAIDLSFSLSLLTEGNNAFTIRNHTSAFAKLKPDMSFPESYLTNVKYQVSDVQILLSSASEIPAVPALSENTFLGHMISGHDVVHLEHENFSRVIELFRRGCQGNLIVLLMSPGKTNYDIDLDLIDTDAIIDAGLYVALR